MCNARAYNQAMHNLVTGAPHVKSIRIPLLGNLLFISFMLAQQNWIISRSATHPHSVQGPTSKVECRHQCHPVKAHSPHLRFPTKYRDSMNDGNDERQPKASIHGCTVWAVLWTTESRVQSCVHATGCQNRYKGVICLLQMGRAIEAVVNARDGGAPH